MHHLAKCHSVLTLLLVLVLPATTLANSALKIVQAARSQIGITVYYDPAYRKIAYPNGDVPRAQGVCTDVIIRALRDSLHLDLQKLVHEDMLRHFASYPPFWHMKHTDPSIDHRRVPNLQTFFTRKGWSLPVTNHSQDYLPGDIVTVILPPHLPHIMIVSDRKNTYDIPLIIHNIGTGTQEEDTLFSYPHTGHYRIQPLH